MQAVLTVIGQDKIGIIASVSQKLASLSINVLDVNQTIMGQNFTMMMRLDLTTTAPSFEEIRQQLHQLAAELGVQIHIQNEVIFDAMHKL